MQEAPNSHSSLQEKIAQLPQEPGVYIFYDSSERIIYIGKATQLKSRVRSYFSGADDGRPLFRYIVKQTADIECILCSTELEALLLENNLIKKHRPRYNVRLRDDKSYLSLRLTTGEDWPRVQAIRHWKKDSHLYFGPYSSANSVREMLRVIKKFIPLRTCSNSTFKQRTRPCMEYEIGNCDAPCVGLTTHEEYDDYVQQCKLFLQGRNKDLLPKLEERMRVASEKLEFERAAKYRDQIQAINRLFEKQNVQELRFDDMDVFGLYRHNDFVCIQSLLGRNGKLIASANHAFRTLLSNEEVLSNFLTQYYTGDRFLPPEILLPQDFPDRELIQNWLESKREKKVRLWVPIKGDKRKLIDMANRNAEHKAETDVLKTEAIRSLGDSLAQKIGVEATIERIECYDISGFQGSLQVASKVVFDRGEADLSHYRRYKIKTVKGTDDFASMFEVLSRRLKKSNKRDPLPDLIMVDGGKGQIKSALDALALHKLDIPVIGIAKDRLKDGEHSQERIYAPGRSEALDIPQESQESLYLQRIRDEAHRFANSFHKELRKKKMLITGLEEIPGVGEVRRKALLRHFGSLKALRNATREDIQDVAGMTKASANSTFDFLHSKDKK